jgi:hypothetical protein
LLDPANVVTAARLCLPGEFGDGNTFVLVWHAAWAQQR